MPLRKVLNRLLFGALVAFTISLPTAAQSHTPSSKATSAPAKPADAASGYNLPPKNILDVMNAPSPPYPSVSPTHDAILLVSWQDYPSISRVATPFLRLAGVRVEPGNHSKHDTPGGYGITPCARSFDLVHVADAAQIHVALPAGACPGEPTWSADGKRFAFVIRHNNEDVVVRALFQAIDGADIGMIEGGGGTRFAEEIFFVAGVQGDVVWEEFEGNGALEFEVAGFVNNTHATGAELVGNFAMRNGLTQHGVALRGGILGVRKRQVNKTAVRMGNLRYQGDGRRPGG